MPRWIFDELSASTQRKGGNAAEYAFDPNLDTFVREVVQNANDQALGDLEVVIRFVELSGRELEAFRDALSWETLSPHLRAVADTDHGLQMRQYLERIEQQDRLVLLVVEDRNTVGLVGHETEGESNFRALCRDTLFTNKPDSSSAGGSYGLGKSVLWSFSGLSTVLFTSTLSDTDDARTVERRGDRSSPRLVGRCELPTHGTSSDDESDAEFDGPGWFGRVVEAERGARAESVWGDRAAQLAEALHCSRPRATGTSAVVVGFDPPAAESEPPHEVSEYRRDIISSGVEHFWPAMVRERQSLELRAESGDWCGSADPLESHEFRPFVEAFQKRTNPDDELEVSGDVVTAEIPFTLPARKDRPADADGVEGQVTLAVRLAHSSRSDDGFSNRVALFRRPGMVVKYFDQSRLAVGMRPFHALLICGEARLDPDESDRSVEQFLRRAEPPGHDAWTSTKALRERYKRGYLSALNDLKQRLKACLRELVVPQPTEGSRGPDKLRRRFPMSSASATGGRGRGESSFHYEQLDGIFVDGRWGFSTTVRPESTEHSGWEAQLEIVRVGEDGRAIRDARLDIQEFSLDADDVEAEVEAGVGRLAANPGVDEISLVAWTMADTVRRGDLPASGEVELRLQGELFVDEDETGGGVR